MKIATKTFGRRVEYKVDLEIDIDETQGWVSCKADGSEYTASLAAMEGTGVLTDMRLNEHEVPEEIQDEIIAWAEAEGY